MTDSTLVYTLSNFHPQRRITRHAGLIPDGTRRWARNWQIPLLDAYLETMNRIVIYTERFFEEGCTSVSVYLCSTQNLKRNENELSALFDAQCALCLQLRPMARKWKTRIVVAGEKGLLPRQLRMALEEISNSTNDCSSTRMYLCVPYNPLSEILDAMRVSDPHGSFVNNLWVPEPLDLVIRTGGVTLLSNFLPLQAGYARIYTIDKLFNDTTVEDFTTILNQFKQINRLYGD